MKRSVKSLLAVIAVPAILAGCTQTPTQSSEVTEADLLHHNWNLSQIDGAVLVPETSDIAPRIEIGENLTVNGDAGCNNFFGQAELKNGQFRVENMGMTMKMCPPMAMGVEDAITTTLTEWSEITIEGQTLTLKGAQHTLVYQLADWVN
ncbi:META domain-containing protein [Vibrio sp. SM6]|uniref:META domain-containing protein n=1 Tax=Vibrio agarilyticus TaxID=2726741 RepID=A0A7X8TNS0_9VIBR|nr:META domain-containing protein [Vibrio agarilyticus]NLS11398.1 META domain-containing protein [Vibrio agarilyticus]